MDKLTKERRSWNMSRIRGKNTKPEVSVRKYLYAHGIRYRIHASLPGKPDIAIPRLKTVLFINGCYWHGHDCKNTTIPKTNTDFWVSKIRGNVERDKRNMRALELDGWRIITVWECELGKNEKATLSGLVKKLS